MQYVLTESALSSLLATKDHKMYKYMMFFKQLYQDNGQSWNNFLQPVNVFSYK